MSQGPRARKRWRVLTTPRGSALAAALLAGVVFALIWTELGNLSRAADLRALRADVETETEIRASAVASAIGRRFALLDGLHAYVEAKGISGDGLRREFPGFAARLYGAMGGIRNFAVAEGGTYRLLYPLEGNEVMVGHDLLRDPREEVRVDTRRAIETRVKTLSGPYELRQGGMGLVTRQAITVDGRTWGLVAIAFDLAPILEEAGIVHTDGRAVIAIRRVGQRPFVGAPGDFDGEAVVRRIPLADSVWEIAARPVHGWSPPGAGRHAWNAAGVVLSLVPMALVFVAFWRGAALRASKAAAEDLVKERTAALARSSETLQAVLRASPLPIITGDRSGNVLSWNEAAERMLGWAADEVVGRPNPAIPEDAWEDLEQMFARADAGESVTGMEVRRRRKNGTLFDARLSIAAVRDRDGALLGMMGVVEDVTERRRADEALRRANRRLEEMLEHVQLIAVTLDTAGRVTYANRYLLDLLGLPADQALGQCWFDLFAAPEERERLLMQYRAAMTGAWFPRHYESVLVSRQGGRREVTWDSTLIHDVEGGIIGWASFGRDVTEQRRLEVQYRQAQKMEAVGQLAGGVAHDFNNLLQVILGYGNLLTERVLPGQPMHEELSEIQRAAERASALVRQLLAFSRRQAIDRRAIDLNDTIADLLKMLRRVIGENIELVFSPGHGLSPVLADPNQVEQILVNLAVNARDAMPDGGRIALATDAAHFDPAVAEQRGWARAGDFVRLSVTDTGPGIPADVLERIFEPFFTTKEVGRGTGLGLATVYGIVKQHDGMIDVESGRGGGTTFRVYLPFSDETAAGRGDVGGSAPLAVGHGTILLAEDEELVRRFAVRLLQGAGYRVLVGRDGEEALAIVETRAAEIDLALLDVVMPKASGLQVCARLRQLRPEVPVLFSSGYSRQVLDGADLPAEGAQLIVKPYEPRALIARVAELLARRASS